MSDQARSVALEFVEEEFVVARGTAEVHWFVRKNDAWQHCMECPGAQRTLLDAGAGFVYRARVELELPLGTRLMRVESRPAQPPRRSTLDHLLKARVSLPRRTARTYFSVGARGLLRAPSAE